MHPGTMAASRPEKTAIIDAAGAWSYRWLDAASRTLAQQARASGLKRGDTLGIFAPNGAVFLAAAWAAQRSGLYALPLGLRLTPADLGYVLKDSGTRLVYSSSALAGVLRDALGQLPGSSTPTVCEIGPAGDIDLANVGDGPDDPDPVEGGDMLYTSGTTGRPKGVRRPLTFAPLGDAADRARRLNALFDMDSSSVFLSPAPLYHAAPLRFSMALLRLGGTLVTLEKFDPEAALTALQQHAVTHSQWVPTMFTRLLALPASTRSRLQAPAHRAAIHAGAPCPEPVKRAMIDWWGPILHEYYSGTESVGFTRITTPEWLQRPGSVGRPWGCEIHILDDTGKRLPPGESGNVYFAGRSTLSYHNAPEKTAAATTPEGLATMGDIGYVDSAGYLFLTDRKAFTIISGGVNIYPREIEDVLRQHPAITEAAVFGSPDEDLGEIVTAVLETQQASGAELARAVCEFASAHLAGFKLPRRIDFRAELPLTDSGKVNKAQLRDAWREHPKQGFDTRKLRTPA